MIIMQRLIKLSIMLALGASCYLYAADEQGWKLQRDKDGILAHTCPVEDSPYDTVRITTRLTKAVASWNFAPQANGSVLISNQPHINPGSAFPGWVTSMLLIDAPYETVNSFVSEVRNPKYVDAQLSFIQELAQ